jgi:hypothetical protein
MEGGEHAAELVHPKRVHETLDETLPPIPERVPVFRNIVNEFKHAILSQTDAEETANKDDTHSVGRLDEALDRIQHLSNILKLVLSAEKEEEYKDYLKEIDPILGVFQQNGFTFHDLEDAARDMCLYYVKTDIDMYPYDLNPKHIDSIKPLKGTK